MPRPATKRAGSEEWKTVTVIEMKKILGFIFVTYIHRKPNLELYFSTRGLFQTPVFSQTMSRNRFLLIQNYIHFSNNNAARTNEDRLYTIRTIFDIVVISELIIYQIQKFLLMKLCLVGGVVCDFIYYNTHMQGVDRADGYLAYYPIIRETVVCPQKVFFYLLQCHLFNSYVTFSKNIPNSCKIIPRFRVRYKRISDTHIRCCIVTVII
jgi:hypothetical protein